MAFHINPSTGNPNVCRSKTCDLTHFETKEAATAAAKPKGAKTAQAVKAVKEELAKDKAVTEASSESVVTVTPDLPAVKAEEVAQEVATAEEKPVVVEKVTAPPSVKLPQGKKKLSAKQQVKLVVNEIADRVEVLASLAPKHPLVKRTKKALRKLKK